MKSTAQKIISLLCAFALVGTVLLGAVGCAAKETNETQEPVQSDSSEKSEDAKKSNEPEKSEDKKEDEEPKKEEKGVETISGKTPEELYKKAKELMSSYKTYTLKTCVKEDVSYEGQNAVLTLDTVQILNNGNVYCKIDSENEEFSTLCCEYWGTETTIYEIITSTSQKIRINMSTNDFLALQGISGYLDNVLMDLDSALFSDAVIAKTEQGTYTVTLSFDIVKYSDMLSGSSIGSLLSVIDPEAFEYYKYCVEFTEDGSFVGITIEAKYTDSGITMLISSTNTLDTENADIPSLPSDADSWDDYTSYFVQ